MRQDSLTVTHAPEPAAMPVATPVDSAGATTSTHVTEAETAERAADETEAEDRNELVEDVDSASIDVDAQPEPVVVQTVAETPVPWLDGLEPVGRPDKTANDQGFVTVIVLLMLGLCFSVKPIRRLWSTLFKQLWVTRPRQDYDHITMVERRALGLLLIVSIFLIGVIITAALSADSAAGAFDFTFRTTLRYIGVVGLYFAFQYIAYYAIGYAFTSADGRKLWLEGFTAAMSMLGLLLLLPGLVVVFYPQLSGYAIPVAAGLYVMARIMFIYKGFRIFYTNIGSIVYFILYLCTLEIVPFTILFQTTKANV